ncbi:unnamed protein product, partial [Didymodactylos carnosus]
VGNYLRATTVSTESRTAFVDPLTNSSKIAFGYNPILGSPVCYTGDCQYEGFSPQPIFSLSYNQHVHGGDPSASSLDEWAKTVESNPVITKFGVRTIFDLLTKYRFPNDSNIDEKRQLLEKALLKYVDEPVYCYDHCGGHGTCIPSSYFGFGECKCDPGWSGSNCFNNTRRILSGTICGMDRSFFKATCTGFYPWLNCPPGWSSKSWSGGDLTVCYKDSSELGVGYKGTVCGLFASANGHHADIPCNNVYLVDDICPSGYTKEVFVGQWQRQRICTKDSNEAVDLPGTLCGIQLINTIDGPACDGYNPGLWECPSGYTPRQWESEKKYVLCAKN